MHQTYERARLPGGRADLFFGSLMAPKNVIIIAQNQPLNNDAHLRKKLADAERRAARQSPRFPDLDLLSLQKGVHRHIRNTALFVDGQYMDLLDLMNYVKAGRRAPELTPDNITRYYSLANTVTLNGIYLYLYLKRYGYTPEVVQNYATWDLSQLPGKDLLAVCISSNFIFMNDIMEMAHNIKRFAPEVPVIAGGMLIKKVLDAGAHFSPRTHTYLSKFHGDVDAFVVEAKGEQTLVKLLACLKQGVAVEKVPNLAYFDETARLHFTPRQEEAIPMDQTAVLWDQVPPKYLRSILPVNSSRGCAYRCRFCTYHWLFPKVSFKSIDVLKTELKQISALGYVRHIRFTDDNFTANKARLQAVLEMIIQEGFDFTWSSFARASALTPELVKHMKRAGCEFVDLGLESGSQRILDNMDKRLACEQSRWAVKLLNDAGIVSRGSFIIGYPGETRDTFAETVGFINDSGLPYYHPYLFYYTGNTLVHKERERWGLRGLGLAWTHDTMTSEEAAQLMSEMGARIDKSFTDGQTYVEEIYKLLRGEGFTARRIEDIFRLKRALGLAMNHNGAAQKTGQILSDLAHLVR